jgi:pyruvate ferredoxin oxidoreductase alpha subunit
MNKKAKKLQILEGSHAIALTIKNIAPAVVSAYPITPQTHIVEDLAKFKADGEANYEYVRAESEFAAASIVLGASATGVRTYSATSSQGLLLMTEVIFNIAGLRLPIVMTCANRSISAPINIWNDTQDVMVIRDSGWILLFAENHQEAISQHIMAYKIAEATKLPVMVNVDGYLITHSYEPAWIPEKKTIQKYLGQYRPTAGTYLNPQNPVTIGSFASPQDYMEIRQELHEDLVASQKIIEREYINYQKTFGTETNRNKIEDNGLIEYSGPQKPQAILVAMGSVLGTIRAAIKENHLEKTIGILKIRTYRPFPKEAVIKIINRTKNIAVIEKALSLGQEGPLSLDLKALLLNRKTATNIQNYIVGLGGRDITKQMIKKIIKDILQTKQTLKSKFVNN